MLMVRLSGKNKLLKKSLEKRVILSSLSTWSYLDNADDFIGYGNQPWAGAIGRVYRFLNNISYLINKKTPIGNTISASSCASFIELLISLYLVTEKEYFRNRAIEGANWLIENQNPKGYWEFRTFEEKSIRIQTVDSTAGAKALLRLYELHPNETYLNSSNKWARFLIENGMRQLNQDRLFFEYYFWVTCLSRLEFFLEFFEFLIFFSLL